MIKNTVINAELGYALATARHKDAIVICDANIADSGWLQCN